MHLPSLFFTVHRNQPQGKWLLFALLNKANIHPDMLKDANYMTPPPKKKSCDTLFHIRQTRILIYFLADIICRLKIIYVVTCTYNKVPDVSHLSAQLSCCVAAVA